MQGKNATKCHVETAGLGTLSDQTALISVLGLVAVPIFIILQCMNNCKI